MNELDWPQLAPRLGAQLVATSLPAGFLARVFTNERTVSSRWFGPAERWR